MKILFPTDWKDYQLIDSGEGFRLEQYGPYRLMRPDPQIIWKRSLSPSEWEKADAIFEKTSGDKGAWKTKKQLPSKWLIRYKGLNLYAKLSSFKHTGIFPEQAVAWDYISTLLTKSSKQASVLNLFGYTGAASLIAAKNGALVTHVDASRSSISWARENQEASKLTDKPIRWILDDSIAFVDREIRRGKTYDGIIMDPPVYGHGPNGETWDFNKDFPRLLEKCRKLLSNNPIFLIVNAYAISSSSIMLNNMLSDLKMKGTTEYGELTLKETNGRLLSTGIFGRISFT